MDTQHVWEHCGCLKIPQLLLTPYIQHCFSRILTIYFCKSPDLRKISSNLPKHSSFMILKEK